MSGQNYLEIEKADISYMLDEGVIEPWDSQFANPVLRLPNPDGTIRLCIVYWILT